ncbi:hypothetical protein AKJ50_01060 [candidate division MSBL1 archaeon SCGC-AAA382A13]|uniref:Uncharacterized protein n=1 Tax=candidate division MSBL1 archaeon SCGC-AAA382A13 TaxID=1698279 RepID=A0A133VG26_9EURY|nr:hypothetical protein AKJ50_01060 [candidate division MSBL1 archaeon SCGC-AAA382A13]
MIQPFTKQIETVKYTGIIPVSIPPEATHPPKKATPNPDPTNVYEKNGCPVARNGGTENRIAIRSPTTAKTLTQKSSGISRIRTDARITFTEEIYFACLEDIRSDGIGALGLACLSRCLSK